MMNETSFVKEIKDLPFLTAERELELGTIIQTQEDSKQKSEAIVELVEHNLRLVLKEAFKYSHVSSVPVEELYNAGRLGLIRAAYKYNPVEFKSRFSTYATPWIQQGMRESIHSNGPVYIPLHIINGKYRKNRMIEENGDMTDAQIMGELSLTAIQLERINMANVSSVSLNATVGNDNDDTTTVGDLMADESAEIPGVNGIEDQRYEYLEDAMSELDDMSKEIIMSQILYADKVKLSDLGKRYGISGERVRQIKTNALAKLKKKIQCRMSLNGEIAHVAKIEKNIAAPSITQKIEKIEKKRGRPKKVKENIVNKSIHTWKRTKHGSVTVHSCYREGKRIADVRSDETHNKIVRVLRGCSVLKSWTGNGKTIEALKNEVMCHA